MRWRQGRRSSNIEDRRGEGGSPLRGIPIPGGMAGAGISGAGLLAIIVIAVVLGVDPGEILGPSGPSGPISLESSGDDDLKDFVSVVLADTEDTWQVMFLSDNLLYREPKLVLFRNAIDSACGYASSAVGPFYCPADRKIYLDLGFFRELDRKHGAPGDFAQAYVIAHEVGHHVQALTGITAEVQGASERMSEAEANETSVRVELQADCLAGIWAHYAHRDRDMLEPGDLDEAIAAAQAVGDDRLQQRAEGRVVPDSFTHGTSEQRARWFRRGFDAGLIQVCDTFGASQL